MSPALADTLARDLAEVVGENAVITDPGRLLVYESDGLTAYRGTPGAVVLPADTDEAARVVRLLAEEGVAVVPRGAGTGLSGGAVAPHGAVMVGTSRMDRILDIDPENRTARVQAGTINSRLSERARPHGLYYAPDPSSQTACTLGGNVAENSGGPHCLKYGVTSRYVMGLTMVLPSGEVTRLGGPAEPRESAGYDLVGLVVGSEGCFGLVTEVEVALLPVPGSVRTLLAVFSEIEDAARAVTDIIGSGLLPAALEIVDSATIEAVEASVFAAGYPKGAGAALVVEFDGTEAGLDADAERAERCCRENGAAEVRRARTEEERAALWKGRKKAFGAMGRVAPDLMVQDATVPRTRLPSVLSRIADIAERYELRVANVFHAGDGNLHPNILFDRRDEEQLERVEKASTEIMHACVEAGGTITGEHGVGMDKRSYMRLVHGEAELKAMAAVKAVFDPEGRFNPGKVLPDDVLDEVFGGRGPVVVGGRRGGAPVPPARVGEGEGPAPEGADPAAPPGSPRRRVRPTDSPPGDPVTLEPASTEEVAAILREASSEGWRVLPVGGRLLLGASGPSDPVDIVLDTRRLSGIGPYEPADLVMTAGAGVTLETVRRRTAEAGQWLPVDPPGDDGASLGGVVATGLGGPLSTAFGRPRDLVLGLTCVTGDGRIVELGGRVVKNVAGFDLLKLVVGSSGTLAVVTEVTVRLYPLPAADRLLTVEASRLEELVPAARALATAPILPATVELTEGVGTPGARLAVRLLGTEETVEAEVGILRERVPELRQHPPDGAATVLSAAREVEAGAGASFRFGLPPARLEEGVARARALTEARLSGPRLSGEPARIVCDALRGTVRVALASTPALPEGGASGSESGSSRNDLPASVIQEGLKRHFDPAGSLGPGPVDPREV